MTRHRGLFAIVVGAMLGFPAWAHAEYAEGMEHYRKAWAAYGTQRFDEAEEWAERAVRADRQNAHAYALLGDLAYLRHDLGQAKQAWSRALTLNPQLAALGAQIAQADLELGLESRMEPVHLGSLVIRVPKSEMASAPAGLRHDIVMTLERAMETLEPYFQYRPRRPLTVLLYPPETFYATTHLPLQVLGLFDGKIRVPVHEIAAGPRNDWGVLWHEYTHALVYDLSHGQAPRWLQEGLAQECEVIAVRGRPSSPRTVAVHPVRPELVEGRTELPPLRAILGIAEGSGVMPAGQFYGGSHLLVKYLLELKGWDGMRRLLASLGQGKSVEKALKDLTGWDLPTLEQKWRAWLP